MGRHRGRPVDPPNPSGRCWCNCGQITSVAWRTDTKQGIVKGERLRFLPGHSAGYASKQRAVGTRYRPRLHPVEGPWNPDGRCWCGCGAVTPLATRTRTKEGIIAGMHLRYLPEHRGRGAWSNVKDRARPQQQAEPVQQHRQVQAERHREQRQHHRMMCLDCLKMVPTAATIGGICAVCVLEKQRRADLAQQATSLWHHYKTKSVRRL